MSSTSSCLFCNSNEFAEVGYGTGPKTEDIAVRDAGHSADLIENSQKMPKIFSKIIFILN